jgi:hypothetical protein
MNWEEKFSVADLAKEISNPFKDAHIELVGQWSRFDRVMRYLTAHNSSEIKRDIAKGQRDFLERYKYNLINALVTEGRSVGAPFAEHSPNYHSPTGLIGRRTDLYLNALRSLRITSSNYVLSLSFTPGITHQKSKKKGLTLARYAYIFEEGSLYQPARPIWGPTFRSIGGRQKAQQYLKSAVGNRINNL